MDNLSGAFIVTPYTLCTLHTHTGSEKKKKNTTRKTMSTIYTIYLHTTLSVTIRRGWDSFEDLKELTASKQHLYTDFCVASAVYVETAPFVING